MFAGKRRDNAEKECRKGQKYLSILETGKSAVEFWVDAIT